VLVRAVRDYRRAAVGAAVFLVLCLSLGFRLGTEFLPKLEEGNLWIRAVMPPTITLEAGMEPVAKIRAIISSYPPVQTVFSEQGRGDEGTDPDGSFLAEFFVPLKPADAWPSGLTKEQMVKQMSEKLNREFVGVDFNFSQYIQDNIEEAVSGVKGENSIKIFGRDLVELERLSKSVKTELSGNREHDLTALDKKISVPPSHGQFRPFLGSSASRILPAPESRADYKWATAACHLRSRRP